MNIEIGELESHFRSLKYQSAVDLLLEAIILLRNTKHGSFGSVTIVLRSLVIRSHTEIISGRCIGWVNC